MSTTVGEYHVGTPEVEEAGREREAGARGGENENAPGTGRLLSLDAFRGLTVAGMILVNNPGSWAAVYGPLQHAAWHGWTPTDLIFPFFLFIVGVSITLALSRRAEAGGTKRDLYVKIVRRSAIIFGLGLFLYGFPLFNLATIRVTGVLQRIAVCYLFAALIFLWTGWRGQVYAAAALLLGYWAILAFVPAPGFAPGDLSKEGSVVSYLDRTLLGSHIWLGGERIYDPEGILSALGALATTLLGVLAGHLLRSRRSELEKVVLMFVAGAAGVVAGWAWNFWLPVNKPLWTGSYVLFTAGMALQLLAVCYWLIDLKGCRRWATPFVVFGVNALAVFFLMGLFAKMLTVIKFAADEGKRVTLKAVIYNNVFAPWASPLNASLAYAVCFVLLWLGLMWLLYRRGIYIKV